MPQEFLEQTRKQQDSRHPSDDVWENVQSRGTDNGIIKLEEKSEVFM